MREIKVRGYAIEKIIIDSQWLVGFGVYEVKFADHYAKEVGRSSDWWIYTDSGEYQVDPKSVGQYTGLLDKNGKEIYEGDIVYIFDDEEQGNGWGETVIYHRACFMAGDENLLVNVHSRCAVIGNIYENPELINS